MLELDHIIPPPTAFYFNVHFVGPLPIADMAFIEVSGLSMQLTTQEVDLGGGNKRKMPMHQQHGNLVCKRPMKPLLMSSLSVWVATTMSGIVDAPIIPCDAVITLLSPVGTPECGWFVKGAYPVKWDIASFDSKKNDIAIESIEFVFDTVTRVM